MKENDSQGGGLSPVVGGDDQIPANDIMMSSQGSMEHSSVHNNLFACIWGYNVTGALSHRREEVSVTISRR